MWRPSVCVRHLQRAAAYAHLVRQHASPHDAQTDQPERAVGRVVNQYLIGILAIALNAFAGRLMAQAPPAGPAPGVLVDIGGHKLHLRCVGPADAKPTVIFEAGGGAFSSAWSQVQDLLSGDVRSCAYDRAGSGWSEAGPAPR